MVKVIPPLESVNDVHNSKLVCVNLYELQRVLGVLSDMHDFIQELREEQESDSELLHSMRNAVKELTTLAETTNKTSLEHQTDLDYLFRKVNLHSCKARSFVYDCVSLCAVIRTLAMLFIAMVVYTYTRW